MIKYFSTKIPIKGDMVLLLAFNICKLNLFQTILNTCSSAEWLKVAFLGSTLHNQRLK